MDAYSSATEVLEDRIRWAIALMNELVQRGRATGWLSGEPRAIQTAAANLAAAIGQRMAHSKLGVAPLHWLASQLELDATALDAVWVLVTVECSPLAARLADNFATTTEVDLSLQTLQQLVPISPRELDALARLAILEVEDDASLPLRRRRVRVHDRVIDLARGEIDLDRELDDIVEVIGVTASRSSPPPHLVAAFAARPAPLLASIGPGGAGRMTVLADVAALHGLGTLQVRCARLGGDTSALRRRIRAILREARLLGLVPAFRDVDVVPGLTALLDLELLHCAVPVFATSRELVAFSSRTVVGHTLEIADLSLRRDCWRAHLALEPELLEATAARYVMRPGSIVAVANTVAAGESITAATIQAGVREYLASTLAPVAERIVREQSWDDLVLPADQYHQLIELVARVRQRTTVLETWGFRAKVAKGIGVAALLSGPPGTGKTMVASLIARELELDLYQVDLSKIVSKFIGETEKQLAVLFDAAESGQAVVLFDEADALFAKRTEVKSSNDRYANLEVNYLLQRLEAFTGIALLTTNHESAIDPAFRRRLAVHVRFPLPEESEREQLWQAMLPAQAAVSDDIDYQRLAREFAMSGGYIRNAALRAAYLAADMGTSIAMEHLCFAARAEYESMGRVIVGH